MIGEKKKKKKKECPMVETNKLTTITSRWTRFFFRVGGSLHFFPPAQSQKSHRGRFPIRWRLLCRFLCRHVHFIWACWVARVYITFITKDNTERNGPALQYKCRVVVESSAAYSLRLYAYIARLSVSNNPTNEN